MGSKGLGKGTKEIIRGQGAGFASEQERSREIILQTARIYSSVPGKVLGWRSAVGSHCKFNRCAV